MKPHIVAIAKIEAVRIRIGEHRLYLLPLWVWTWHGARRYAGRN